MVAFSLIQTQGNAKESQSYLVVYEKKKKGAPYHNMVNKIKQNSLLFLMPKYLKERFFIGKNKVKNSRFLTFSPLSPTPRILKKNHFRFPNTKRKKNKEQTDQAKNTEDFSLNRLYFNQKDEKYLDQEDKKN